MEIKPIDITEIKPSSFQPRETFDEESIRQLAKSIEKVSLLQPIIVRPIKGAEGEFEIVAGERRWRACRYAGIPEIPAIIKDIDDSRAAIESLIENLQREDLNAIEKAKGLAEAYRRFNLLDISLPPPSQSEKVDDDVSRSVNSEFTQRSPSSESSSDSALGISKIVATLLVLHSMGTRGLKRELTLDERSVKQVADMIGLSYRYQAELLSALKLEPEEQKRATELELDHERISSISSVADPEARKRLLEIAPKIKREEVSKISKIANRASAPVTQAVLSKKISPEVAEKLLELPESKQVKTIDEIKMLKLDDVEAQGLIEHLKTQPDVLEQPLTPQPPQVSPLDKPESRYAWEDDDYSKWDAGDEDDDEDDDDYPSPVRDLLAKIPPPQPEAEEIIQMARFFYFSYRRNLLPDYRDEKATPWERLERVVKAAMEQCKLAIERDMPPGDEIILEAKKREREAKKLKSELEKKKQAAEGSKDQDQQEPGKIDEVGGG